MTRALTNEEPIGPLVRLRPRCPDCSSWCVWTWRCWCFVGDPPRVHDCEANGLWMCFECPRDVDVIEVAV